MRFIGIDPGGTTGIAIYDSEAKQWTRRLVGPDEHHLDLWNLLDYFRAIDDVNIICESFEYRNQSRSGLVLVSNEYIGVVKHFCQKTNFPLTMRTAGVGKCGQKTFVRAEHLKRLGLWLSGTDDSGRQWKHAMDATAHVLYHLIHQTPTPIPELKKELLQKGWR